MLPKTVLRCGDQQTTGGHIDKTIRKTSSRCSAIEDEKVGHFAIFSNESTSDCAMTDSSDVHDPLQYFWREEGVMADEMKDEEVPQEHQKMQIEQLSLFEIDEETTVQQMLDTLLGNEKPSHYIHMSKGQLRLTPVGDMVQRNDRRRCVDTDRRMSLEEKPYEVNVCHKPASVTKKEICSAKKKTAGTRWDQKLHELRKFKLESGHCDVPQTYATNPALGTWVKNQRAQYKRSKEGKPCKMDRQRIEILNEIGFSWDCKPPSWDERLEELLHYKELHGNCDVPRGYKANHQLARWVNTQRTQYKLFKEGKSCKITRDRIEILSDIGFAWSCVKSARTK